MSFADVDDNLRTFGEVNPVHQFAADRAGPVADLFEWNCPLLFQRQRFAEDRRLLFAIGTDLLQRIDVCPNAVTLAAFLERCLSDQYRMQRLGTTWAKQAGFGGHLRASRFG